MLQQWEIVKRLPWCAHIASYYMLFSGRKLELLILWVKLTIFIKCLGVAQIVFCVTAKWSNATGPAILDRGNISLTLHAHRTQHFYEVFHYNFFWYLMIRAAAEREAQPGQLITVPASGRKREGVIWGKLLGDWSIWVILFLHPALYGAHLLISHALQQSWCH